MQAKPRSFDSQTLGCISTWAKLSRWGANQRAARARAVTHCTGRSPRLHLPFRWSNEVPVKCSSAVPSSFFPLVSRRTSCSEIKKKISTLYTRFYRTLRGEKKMYKLCRPSVYILYGKTKPARGLQPQISEAYFYDLTNVYLRLK